MEMAAAQFGALGLEGVESGAEAGEAVKAALAGDRAGFLSCGLVADQKGDTLEWFGVEIGEPSGERAGHGRGLGIPQHRRAEQQRGQGQPRGPIPCSSCHCPVRLGRPGKCVCVFYALLALGAGCTGGTVLGAAKVSYFDTRGEDFAKSPAIVVPDWINWKDGVPDFPPPVRRE